MSLIGRLHGGRVYGRRVEKLASRVAAVIPEHATVLDVGCGDGLIASRVMLCRPDVRITGVDVLVRDNTYIPVEAFDGKTLPHQDDTFDVVSFVDVLHHTDDPMVLLREAVRVARMAVVLKDHTRNGLLAGPTLRFMDWVGNARHGVVLPYNYWPRQKWDLAFAQLELQADVWSTDLNLYARPANLLFDRSLHFVARLIPA